MLTINSSVVCGVGSVCCLFCCFCGVFLCVKTTSRVRPASRPIGHVEEWAASAPPSWPFNCCQKRKLTRSWLWRNAAEIEASLPWLVSTSSPRQPRVATPSKTTQRAVGGSPPLFFFFFYFGPFSTFREHPRGGKQKAMTSLLAACKVMI